METVARLAAEAAAGARPDLSPRLEALETSVQQILDALTAAAGPEGNAAKLAARLEAVESGLAELRGATIAPDPEQQNLIDDLRLRVATLERNKT